MLDDNEIALEETEELVNAHRSTRSTRRELEAMLKADLEQVTGLLVHQNSNKRLGLQMHQTLNHYQKNLQN